MAAPVELRLQIHPRRRFDLIDIRRRIGREGEPFPGRHALLCSFHTTAGYLAQETCRSAGARGVRSRIQSFQRLFPPGAPYRHDELELRDELSEEQRRIEPRNGDSHLTFIGSGLQSCVTWRDVASDPLWFIELDGVHEGTRRVRRTSIIAFDREEEVCTLRFPIFVSSHAVDAVNLKDPAFGLFERIGEEIRRHGIAKGRVDVRLCPDERHAALTVNEHETLLMRHDLALVLRDPLHFAACQSFRALADPGALPGKLLDYVRHDAVKVLQRLVDALGPCGMLLDRALGRLVGLPADRLLRLQRCLSLPVCDRGDAGRGEILQGTYQSPILMQWRRAHRRRRELEVSLFRLL